MTVALVDDQALSLVLLGKTPRSLRHFDLATTGYWYVRLCQAVLAAHERAGVLSGPFADLPPPLHRRAVDAVLELPETIALVSLRELGPVIGRLRTTHALNVLGMEALAAAATSTPMSTCRRLRPACKLGSPSSGVGAGSCRDWVSGTQQ